MSSEINYSLAQFEFRQHPNPTEAIADCIWELKFTLDADDQRNFGTDVTSGEDVIQNPISHCGYTGS